MRFAVVAVIVGLPALQLVPLPSFAWAHLPGRAAIAQSFAGANLPLPWLPVSLTPAATERTLLGILPAVSLFLAVPCLSAPAQRRLMHAAIVIGLLDVFVGLGQLLGGEGGLLRFYAGASRSDAVGLFANRNHHALFLASLVPLAAALFSSGSRAASERAWLAATVAILLLGIAASGSRAGLILGAGACLAAAWIVLGTRPGARRVRRVAVWGGLAAVPLLVGLGVFGAIGSRLNLAGLSGDLRWQIARSTWQALTAVWPIGSGFGSFQRFYAGFERHDELIAPIINNAHDDWLEVTLEGGLPALLLLIGALAYLVHATLRPRSGRDEQSARRATRSGTLAILWFCALHSTVDYPLRTMAVNVLVALACGLRVAASTGATVASEPLRRRGTTDLRATRGGTVRAMDRPAMRP